jgi:hypothetical protein
MPGFTFYLGTHRALWLGRVAVPLFLSRRVLPRRGALRPALAPWALDSGAFTELSLYGRWTVTPADYAGEVRRWALQAGGMRFASPQDWMCEPFMLDRTGLTVAEHQRRTADNFLELRSLAPELPWLPVLQGWAEADYLRHADQYAVRGVDLAREPLVGVGSVCRRQDTRAAERLVCRLARQGLRLHLFGYKLKGLAHSARFLASSDSMAWSYDARRATPLPGCQHKSCANCLRYALAWREKALRAAGRGLRRAYQETLW